MKKKKPFHLVIGERIEAMESQDEVEEAYVVLTSATAAAAMLLRGVDGEEDACVSLGANIGRAIATACDREIDRFMQQRN